MQKLPTFLRDTKHALQLIEEKNETGIPENVNFLTADIEQMYPKVPWNLCETGVAEYLDSRRMEQGQPSTQNIIKCLRICQENNIFEFMNQLYRQTSGSAIGQKQAPSVACLGAGIIERKVLNQPREIVFNTVQGRILSKPADDPIFWSVRDFVYWFKRFIDDVFCLFSGDEKQAEWFMNLFNNVCPGVVKFTHEFSEVSTIFLNMKLILNREANMIEVDYYVKPTNKQLFLHFRSDHPKHVFKAIIYNQALLAVTVCSRSEWAENYLEKLKYKFLEQEYPLEMIEEQFEKAKKLDRTELILKKKQNKKENRNKKRMKNCLVITGNPGNPPFFKWIKQLLPTLHRDPKLKDLIPDIPVVVRQPPSVGSCVIRSKHWKVSDSLGGAEPGCVRIHQPDSCVCCLKMDENVKKFQSSATNREYEIRRNYTCQSKWVVYVVTCTVCNIQYTGQTIQEVRKRHYGHRNEIRNGIAGLGSHFHDTHGAGMDLSQKQNLKTCMAGFSLVVVASVKPPSIPEEIPACQARLDRLEGDLQHRLRCMSENGGMNIRDETIRRRRN